MDKIFIMNLGTTSFKFKLFLFGAETQQVLCEGELESIGSKSSHWSMSYPDGRHREGDRPIPDHGVAFAHFAELLQQDGTLKDMGDLDAVGYKAVHGGNLSGTCPVDDALLAEMERFSPMLPAHNPIYINAMKEIRAKFPELKQVARFETSFHATVPEYRAVYGVPYEWHKELGVRRYGFHGSSHQYIAGKLQELEPQAKRVVNCHLGGSSSICGILEGKSIATSMGATTQSGLFNNNRVGDLDVFAIPAVIARYGCSFQEVLNTLSRQSGILGISGVSNDLREVMEAMEAGNQRAKLAVDALVDNIVGYVGMYATYLGGLDALVFTGGIGTNSAYIREKVCEKFAWLGLKLDSDANSGRTDGKVSTPDSAISVWRLKTNEELVVGRCVWEYLHGK